MCATISAPSSLLSDHSDDQLTALYATTRCPQDSTNMEYSPYDLLGKRDQTKNAQRRTAQYSCSQAPSVLWLLLHARSHFCKELLLSEYPDAPCSCLDALALGRVLA